MKKRKLIAPVLIVTLSLQMVSCNNILKDRDTKNRKESTKQTEMESAQGEEVEAVLEFSDDQKSVIGIENRETATYAVIPEGITAIRYDEENRIGCFSNCKKMTRVTIPDSVTVIDYMAFENCERLTEITIPDNLSWIGMEAFEGCESLTNIHIPEGVTSIEYGAFRWCESLTDITLPNNVERIDGEAFAGCKNLQSIYIPEGVTSIGNGAFSDCSSLTSVTIPKSVTEIENGVESEEDVYYNSDGTHVFDNCYFTKENFKNNSALNAIDNFNWGAKIVDSDENGICIKNNVLRYVRPSISGAITIPDNVKWIGESAFRDCTNIISITCPENSMIEFKGGEFSECKNLTSITWKGTTYNSVEEFELTNLGMK